MALSQSVAAVSDLYQRYDNVSASLVNACLVRLSRLYVTCSALTLDNDFHSYRSFQKKSKSGIATPKEGMDTIRARLKVAEALAKELNHGYTNH